MKQLRKALNSVLKELKALTRKTEAIEKKLVKFENAQTSKKTKAKAAKKKIPTKIPTKGTAIDTVFAIIKKSRKGVDTATLKKKTGFNDKKVWNNVNTLKRKGKIKSAGRGVYVKA